MTRATTAATANETTTANSKQEGQQQ